MKTKIAEMTDQALAQAARRYNQGMFGDTGEGYNPYTAEMDSRATRQAALAPRDMHAILRDLDRCDCSLARECGTYDEVRVATLQEELRAAEAAEAQREANKVAAFWAEWTPETTADRRAQWNTAAKNAGRQARVVDIQKAVGFAMVDLKKAVKHYRNA